VIRATEKEKLYQITMLDLHKANHDKVDEMLNTIQAAINNENLFDHLEATKVCSLGQITSALFEVGVSQYRNM
jgi:methylmalonyl-CoA mutase